jgi:cyclopropane fatty-acyl-phospholipid synthase-like methyltransferase
MDKKYWENYYSHKKAVHYPSPFAEYCVKRGLVKNSVVLDIGCGNGRDSFYFVENSAEHVIGIDQSEVAISNNTNNIDNLEHFHKNQIEFSAVDFVNLDSYCGISPDLYYSRFTFHAITHKEQLEFIAILSSTMKPGSVCAIEARTVNDKTFQNGTIIDDNTNFTDHHRCFSIPNNVIKDVIKHNFEIIYFEESTDFAKFNNEAPSVMRLIFKKSN